MQVTKVDTITAHMLCKEAEQLHIKSEIAALKIHMSQMMNLLEARFRVVR